MKGKQILYQSRDQQSCQSQRPSLIPRVPDSRASLGREHTGLSCLCIRGDVVTLDNCDYSAAIGKTTPSLQLQPMPSIPGPETEVLSGEVKAEDHEAGLPNHSVPTCPHSSEGHTV